MDIPLKGSIVSVVLVQPHVFVGNIDQVALETNYSRNNCDVIMTSSDVLATKSFLYIMVGMLH